MQRSILRAALVGPFLVLAGLSVGHAQQTAGEVYQWKDARGVTHFAQSPPPKGAYQQRVITHSGNPAPVTTAANVTVADNPQCTTARNNITALQGKTEVQQDTDGDGKPDKTLSDTERTGQMELAQAAVKAYCTS